MISEYAISIFGVPGRSPRSSRGDGVERASLVLWNYQTASCATRQWVGRGRGVALNAADAFERSQSWRSCPSTRRRGDDRGHQKRTRAMNEGPCDVGAGATDELWSCGTSYKLLGSAGAGAMELPVPLHQPEAAHAAPNLAGRQRMWSGPRRSAALAMYGPRGPQYAKPLARGERMRKKLSSRLMSLGSNRQTH